MVAGRLASNNVKKRQNVRVDSLVHVCFASEVMEKEREREGARTKREGSGEEEERGGERNEKGEREEERKRGREGGKTGRQRDRETER